MQCAAIPIIITIIMMKKTKGLLKLIGFIVWITFFTFRQNMSLLLITAEKQEQQIHSSGRKKSVLLHLTQFARQPLH